jgi:hypothetical protein
MPDFVQYDIIKLTNKICIIVWGPFCWKCVRVKSYTYTCTVRACPLIGVFCRGLLIVTAEKGKATEISYSDAHSLVHFFWGFILWQQGTCFYVWLWYKRERTSKHSAIWLILGTNQIASCFDALSITKSTHSTKNKQKQMYGMTPITIFYNFNLKNVIITSSYCSCGLTPIKLNKELNPYCTKIW